MTAPSAPSVADVRMRAPSSSRRLSSLVPCLLLAGAVGVAGCGQETKPEGGAVLLELTMTAAVTTPDEVRLSVYDDGGTLWKDERVPGTGALVAESPTRLGTVLIQPGTAQGKLRLHARGFAASARVADGT